MKNLKMNLKPWLLSALFLLGSSASAQNRAAKPSLIVSSMLKSLASDQKAKSPANPALNAAIIAALPSIKGPAASVAMRLLKTDLSKSESQRFLSPLEESLTSDPQSDFAGLSKEQQSLTLGQALIDAARVANNGAEGIVFLTKALPGIPANGDLIMDTAEQAEGVLLDSHPYLEGKNKRLLGDAYSDLKKQSKAYQDRVTLYASQIASRLVGERGLEDEVVIPESDNRDDRDNREDGDRERSQTSESDREYWLALLDEQRAQAKQQRNHAVLAERRFTEMSDYALKAAKYAEETAAEKEVSPAKAVELNWTAIAVENMVAEDDDAHKADELGMGQHPAENQIFKQTLDLLHSIKDFIVQSTETKAAKEKRLAALEDFEWTFRDIYGE